MSSMMKRAMVCKAVTFLLCAGCTASHYDDAAICEQVCELQAECRGWNDAQECMSQCDPAVACNSFNRCTEAPGAVQEKRNLMACIGALSCEQLNGFYEGEPVCAHELEQWADAVPSTGYR